jgi:hypothetical protein
MIRGRFIIRRIGTLTDSYAISGELIRRRTTGMRRRHRITGFTTPMFPSCPRSDTVTARRP